MWGLAKKDPILHIIFPDCGCFSFMNKYNIKKITNCILCIYFSDGHLWDRRSRGEGTFHCVDDRQPPQRPFLTQEKPCSCKWVPQLSSVWKDESQNHSVIVKGSNTLKCWKTKSFVGPEGFFWRTADSLTVQDKQGTHEQLSLNRETQLWIIQITTVLWMKCVQTFERGHFYQFNYYFILWITCKHLLYEISYSDQY